MPVVQAGLAFRAARPIDDFAALLARIRPGVVEELARPSLEGFDPRQPGDVMLQTFHDACFVCNMDLGLRAVQGDAGEISRLHEALGAPVTMLSFCHDDVQGRHGYALAVAGRVIRRRMQDGPRAAARVVEHGPPQPFERRWLAAAHFVEPPQAPGDSARRIYYLGDREILVPEQELTARLLHDGLEALIGVCPWDTLITPSYRFFRIPADVRETRSPEPGRAAPGRRPWWRRFWH